MKGKITVEGDDDDKKRNKKLAFKNNSRFRSWISNIFNTFIDNEEDLDIVMPMYNVLEYSDNCSIKSGSFWDYYRDAIKDNENENNATNNKINNNKTARKSFEHRIKLAKSTPKNKIISEQEVVGPLKYLSNFWRSPDLPLIDCEIEIDLS